MSNVPLKTKEHIKLTNQSLTFQVFGENEKLTISEITARVNERLEGHAKLSDQTIRRAITSLSKSGLIKPFGKTNNAQTYGRLSAAMTVDEGERLIPFGGELLTVSDFVKLMADPEGEPFTLKAPLISDENQTKLRKLMLYTIITSSSPGYGEELKKAAKQIHNVIAGLEFAADALRAFVDSPVWYEQYRDRIAYALRRLQEEDPKLFELAKDYLSDREG